MSKSNERISKEIQIEVIKHIAGTMLEVVKCDELKDMAKDMCKDGLLSPVKYYMKGYTMAVIAICEIGMGLEKELKEGKDK